MTKFPKFKRKIFLAPMEDITNLPFRLICKEYGAGLVWTEMLSANAIARKNKAVLKKARVIDEERPIAAQLFGQNVDSLVKAAKILEKDFDIIDLNFGCPSVKIMKQGAGGSLLKRKNKIREIVERVSESVGVPVTAKIRLGFDKKEGVEIARICEEAGASAVIVHGRLVKQGYSGKADLDSIKEIKKNLTIPVIGNGDVVDGETAKKMFERTKCDYVMVGRGAIGNPFVFKQINEFLRTGRVIKQKKEEKIKDFFRYVDLAKKFREVSLKDVRRKAIDFTRGFRGSARLRERLNRVKSIEEIEKLVKLINFKSQFV